LSFHLAPHSYGYRRLSSGDDACRHVSPQIARRQWWQATALRESLARLYQFSTSGEVKKNTSA
jgi:hypothetical protein